MISVRKSLRISAKTFFFWRSPALAGKKVKISARKSLRKSAKTFAPPPPDLAKLATPLTAFDVLQWLTKLCLLDSTPYLCLCLKLCLTIGVSIASCERSFSKFKMIKSNLRSTMNDERLSALSILSIESTFKNLILKISLLLLLRRKLEKFNFEAVTDLLFA